MKTEAQDFKFREVTVTCVECNASRTLMMQAKEGWAVWNCSICGEKVEHQIKNHYEN